MTGETEASKVKIPFRAGSKKFLVAQKILAGETDDDKVCREVGVKKATLWNVKSELRKLGYIEKRTISPPATSSTSQTTTPEDASVGLPGETLPPTTRPGEVPELPKEFVGEVARKVVDLLREEGKRGLERLPPGVMPLEAEDVEVVGEKVNYKVALNPEIFWRYNVFKAETERRGRKWGGDFSDFLDLATKDILAVYGIHPTVVSLRGKKLMVELPVEVGGED